MARDYRSADEAPAGQSVPPGGYVQHAYSDSWWGCLLWAEVRHLQRKHRVPADGVMCFRLWAEDPDRSLRDIEAIIAQLRPNAPLSKSTIHRHIQRVLNIIKTDPEAGVLTVLYEAFGVEGMRCLFDD